VDNEQQTMLEYTARCIFKCEISLL